jgi:hypothetical protein
MAPATPPADLRRVLEILEQEKHSGMVDELISAHINLLMSVSNLSNISIDALKANIRTNVNAKMAARLIVGRAEI